MTQIDNKTDTDKTSSRPRWLQIALWVAFLLAALLIAYLTYIAVRDFTKSWTLTDLPGVTVKDATPTPGGDIATGRIDVPLQPEGGPTPPPWDGAERVSLLVMGLDYRDWEAGEGPPRTDTMILLSVDPINRTAGMISIPRDLWVSIPGYDYGRINTAYQLGEAYNHPGGGPALAAETVEQLLGVPIDYYAQIDFGTFVRFIDIIGGVKINVTEKIKIDPLGDGNTRNLKPGTYTLAGDLTLAYVRARKTEGGDFDRAMRQQEVILAIRKQILNYKLLTTLGPQAPVLYQELSSGINTNLTMDQIIRLAWLASQIDKKNIRQGNIGADQIAFAQSPDGSQEVLKPLTEKIRLLRDEIFTATGPASPLAADMDIDTLIKEENARVAVLNGSYTTGLAAQTAEYLGSLGINVVKVDNADKLAPNTELTYYSGRPYTVQYLIDLMVISPFRVRHFFDPTSEVDISIIVGDDWAQNNPMP